MYRLASITQWDCEPVGLLAYIGVRPLSRLTQGRNRSVFIVVVMDTTLCLYHSKPSSHNEWKIRIGWQLWLSWHRIILEVTVHRYVAYIKKMAHISAHLWCKIVECSVRYAEIDYTSAMKFSKRFGIVCKKGQRRLHFLRKLRSFNAGKTILALFYRRFVQSVLTFCHMLVGQPKRVRRKQASQTS